MKAISLWQPWASAIALGLKKIETRHWSTNYRGRLAIHASKRWTKAEREFAIVERALGRLPARIPLGAIVAVVTLADVRGSSELLALGVDPVERIYGNYGPGRFGWLLEDVFALPEPIPYLGRQGFFYVPNDLLPVCAWHGYEPPRPAPQINLLPSTWGPFEGA